MVIELFFDIWSRFRLRPILTSVIWAIFVFFKVIPVDNFEPYWPLFRLFDLSGHFCSRSTKYSILFELLFKAKIIVQKYGDPCFSILYFCSLLVWFLLSDQRWAYGVRKKIWSRFDVRNRTDICLVQTKICTESVRIKKKYFYPYRQNTDKYL